MQNTHVPAPALAERRFRLIFWIVMFMAIPIYYFVMRTTPPEAPTADPTLSNILVPLSVVMVGLSIPIRKLVARRQPKNAFILALALCEAAALYGVVVWSTTGSPRSYYCLLAGAAGMLLHFPRRAHSGANPE